MMGAKLFEPYLLKEVTLKNRIVMAPMCMYTAENDGKVTDWHLQHYAARATGQVGMIIVEATGIVPEGRISENDLGLWSDEHIEGMKRLVNSIKSNGAVAAIQLAHAGRKSTTSGDIYSSSAVRFDENYKVPKEMTIPQIKSTVQAFQDAAKRAKQAGFDVIEIHGAHGYLLNQFLTPVVNQRKDEYGGESENRFQFLKEVVFAVKDVWSGPLMVRVSAKDYDENGLDVNDYVVFSKWLSELGVDLMDISSGGVLSKPVEAFPNYQVPFSEKIRRIAEVPTGTVGLITSGKQAEEILQQGQADLILIGRELLRDPFWPRSAAQELDEKIEPPIQYNRAW